MQWRLENLELEILTKKDNMLLDRIEIQFKISHKNEKTPARDEVREKIAAEINVGKENVIIDFMKSRYGKEETTGYAKIYKTVESAKGSESEHVLVRNKLITAKKKEAKPEAAKKPEPAAEEKEKEKKEAEKKEKPKEEAAKRKEEEGEKKEKPKEAKAEKPERKEEGERKEKPKEGKEAKAEPEKKEAVAKHKEGEVERKEKPKDTKEQ